MRILISSILIICFLGNNFLFAQWDAYPTYEEYIESMGQFEADYPDLCKIEEFGTSVQDRKLLAAKVSNNAAEDEKEPEVFFLAALHGDNTGGYVLMLHLIDYLLSNYGNDALVTHLVDNAEIWINPLVNPDGTYKGGNQTVNGAVRFNANSVDLNRNFPQVTITKKREQKQSQTEPETEAIIGLYNDHHFVMSAGFFASIEGIYLPWAIDPFITADTEWFFYVGNIWIDLAQQNGPPGYFSQGIINDTTGLYPIPGNILDYALYYPRCRDIMVYISNIKVLQASQLLNFWDYQKDAMLSYIEQALYGIRGTVTDSITGDPLEAKVFIENHDKDSSWVFSHLPHGDYYRPIYQGTYDVTFSCDGYTPKTFTGVDVENLKATILNVKLWNGTGNKVTQKDSRIPISILQLNKGVKIIYKVAGSSVNAAIFDVNGRLVRKLRTEAGFETYTIVWNGIDNNGNTVSNGCYIVYLESAGNILTKHFTFSR